MNHKGFIGVGFGLVAGSLVAPALPVWAADTEAEKRLPAPVPLWGSGNAYNLADFGPIGTSQEADRTLTAASKAIQKAGGGIIVIPMNAPAGWSPENVTQEAIRTPAAPAPAKYWWIGEGVTVVDARKATLTLPQFSGLDFERTFNVPPGDSSPHWQYHPQWYLKDNQVKGTTDYSGRLLEAVQAGQARRFHVDTQAGLFPGLMLEVKSGEAREYIRVDTLGYDRQKKRAFFVANAAKPWPAGSELVRQDRLGLIRAETDANNELQTFDINVIRNYYSQGDAYLFDSRISYLGSPSSPQTHREPTGVHDQSGFGSVLYNASIRGDTDIFRGEVASADARENEVVFTKTRNAHKLSTGRPMINMNPAKWVTAGRAYIGNPGGKMHNWGSSLRSPDAPWSSELVGRFFALDEPSEYVPGTDVRRWYQITSFSQEADGTKILGVQRFWWGAKNSGVGISELYDNRNYTSNPKAPVLLKYIIAPGSYVYDVAEGAGRSEAQSAGFGRRAFKVAPYAETGARFDFTAGDRIEQAIGNDPMAPTPLRAWTWDSVPGAFPAAILDTSNWGSSPRTNMWIHGPGGFKNVITINTDTKDVLTVSGDVDKAVVLFRQKEDNLQYITWNGGNARLGVNPESGTMDFSNSVGMSGRGLSGIKGLGKTAGQVIGNFRGIDVAVPVGVTGLDITFPTAEVNDQYALKLQPSWPTDYAVVRKTVTGFRVEFSRAAPQAARIDWLLVR